MDVNEASFQREVIEASYQQPVVVDFWAAWCGPCRVLGPILEKVAAEHQGRFKLVKIDADADPRLAARFGVRGIPAVKAFRDGHIVDQFTGVLPEPRVRQFVARLLPSKADATVREALDRSSEEARTLLQEALAAEPEHGGALLALARLEMDEGRIEEARGLIRRIPFDRPEAREARILEEKLRLMEQAATDGDYGRAVEAILDQRYEEGLETLLDLVRRGEERERARQAMLSAFNLLGTDDPLVRRYQERLASALFG